MKRHWAYLKYVLRHKWYVFWACLELRVPIWIALLHDWDKFLPDEWFAYVRRYANGNNANKAIDSDPAYQMAWHLHQKRNKHHWQWWITPKEDGGVRFLPMTDIYRREMLADWRGMGKMLRQPNTWEWYEVNKGKIHLHPETRIWIEEQMKSLEQTTRTEKAFKAGFFG